MQNINGGYLWMCSYIFEYVQKVKKKGSRFKVLSIKHDTAVVTSAHPHQIRLFLRVCSAYEQEENKDKNSLDF